MHDLRGGHALRPTILLARRIPEPSPYEVNRMNNGSSIPESILFEFLSNSSEALRDLKHDRAMDNDRVLRDGFLNARMALFEAETAIELGVPLEEVEEELRSTESHLYALQVGQIEVGDHAGTYRLGMTREAINDIIDQIADVREHE